MVIIDVGPDASALHAGRQSDGPCTLLGAPGPQPGRPRIEIGSTSSLGAAAWSRTRQALNARAPPHVYDLPAAQPGGRSTFNSTSTGS